MMDDLLFIFDYDETLVHSDGEKEDLDVLDSLRRNDFELCLASRNDKYQIEEELRKNQIKNLFRFVMADFRPKHYQIRHILWLYEKEDTYFDEVFFIDDHSQNIDLVKADLPEIICIQFGIDIKELNGLLALIN